MTDAPEYLRARDIARLTGMSMRTVRRWIANETLPSGKVGGARLVPRKGLAEVLCPQNRPWEVHDSENDHKTVD
jgi:excisionase family DNA binding protein